MASLLPRYTNKLLSDFIVSDVSKEYTIKSLFEIPLSIFPSEKELLNLFCKEEDYHLFFNNMIPYLTMVDHPLNVKFLTKLLFPLSMPERDKIWTIFIHNEYEYNHNNFIEDIIQFCWFGDKDKLDDDQVNLHAMILVWFLTSSNRYLRDRSTKALISLLSERLYLIKPLIEEFKNINDIYILERLLAIAYGCSTRSDDNENLHELAQYIYDKYFSNNQPPPHLLLRDYARGVIELALFRKIDLDIEVNNIRPPYNSLDPLLEEIDEEVIQKEAKDHSQIHTSVMDWDFAWYIIGTNSNSFDWIDLPVDVTLKDHIKKQKQLFFKDFTPEKREKFKEWRNAYEGNGYNFLDSLWKALDEGENIVDDQQDDFEESLKNILDEKRIMLIDSLNSKERTIFENDIELIYKNEYFYKGRFKLDLKKIQKWILAKVVDLGWEKRLFENFDRNVSDPSRKCDKPERIGKKYQWIAYYEIIARIADNYSFYTSFENESERYKNPGQIYIRDIDPTCILFESKNIGSFEDCSDYWYCVPYPSIHDNHEASSSWIERDQDLPDIKKLILTNKDGKDYYCLDALYDWASDQYVKPDNNYLRTKRLFYMIRSYIVKKKDKNKIIEWSNERDFTGRWMPECVDLYMTHMFLREYIWSEAYKIMFLEDWVNQGRKEVPVDVSVTANRYVVEGSGYDCSIDSGFSFYVPSKLIFEGLNLDLKKLDGNYYDNEDNLIAFDPSISEEGPDSLLIDKDKLLEFLEKNDYDIFWTVVAEKGIESKRIDYSGSYYLDNGILCGNFEVKNIMMYLINN